MARPPQNPHPTAPSATDDKVEDAVFLHDEFGIAETEAAELVTPDGSDTDAVRLHDQNKDPLADVPTPRQPNRDMVEDTDEVRLKPVLHDRNERTGSG